LTYLLLGFAAMHPSSSALTEPTARGASRPVAAKVALLGCASLLAPVLLATLVLTNSTLNPMLVAVGGASSSLLVLVRLSDLLRDSESQSVQLAELARTDALTGVPNRRTWDHELARASDHARIEEASLTVVMLDLDHFKHYNDTQGHLAGDLALKETAAAWAHLLVGRGFLARYGGEEFAVFFLDSDPAAVDALARLLHQTVSRGQTCSIGVAVRYPGEPAVQALARADLALYQAKRDGRNRTVWHGTDRQAGWSHGSTAFALPSTEPARPFSV
jgi:diguanylate cyclase (GGDEF)-like protein